MEHNREIGQCAYPFDEPKIWACEACIQGIPRYKTVKGLSLLEYRMNANGPQQGPEQEAYALDMHRVNHEHAATGIYLQVSLAHLMEKNWQLMLNWKQPRLKEQRQVL